MGTKLICPHCGSDKIEGQAWVELNNPTAQCELIDASEAEFYHCCDCGAHAIPIEQECEDPEPACLYILTGRDAITAYVHGCLDAYLQQRWDDIPDGLIWIDPQESNWEVLVRRFNSVCEKDVYITALGDFYDDVGDNYYFITKKEAEEIWKMEE